MALAIAFFCARNSIEQFQLLCFAFLSSLLVIGAYFTSLNSPWILGVGGLFVLGTALSFSGSTFEPFLLGMWVPALITSTFSAIYWFLACCCIVLYVSLEAIVIPVHGIRRCINWDVANENEDIFEAVAVWQGSSSSSAAAVRASGVSQLRGLDQVGGLYPVILNRDGTTAVSKNEVMTDYESTVANGESGYCFLHVLDHEERISFFNVLTAGERLAIYLTRSISTELWFSILDRCTLRHTYNIFRYSYLGESSGSTRPSLTKTNEFVVIYVTSGVHRQSLPPVNLLVHDNHVDKLRPNVKLKIPYWSNRRHALDSKEEEVK